MGPWIGRQWCNVRSRSSGWQGIGLDDKITGPICTDPRGDETSGVVGHQVEPRHRHPNEENRIAFVCLGKPLGLEARALNVPRKDREGRRETLRRELELLGASEPVVLDRASLRKNLKSRLGDWRGLLRRHTAQGQQILRRLLVGRLIFTPTEDETGRYYAFHGTGTLTKLVGGLVPHNAASPTGTYHWLNTRSRPSLLPTACPATPAP